MIHKALFIGALAIFGVSCSKTTEKIGNGLFPEGDHIGAFFTDSLAIECHSMTIDSMVTKGMSTCLLGSMMDPVMGLTDANIFTQLHLSSTHQSFGSEPVIDSVVLQLSVTGYYGDTTTQQTVHVYELADSLASSDYYYQFSDVAVKPIDLANGYQFYPRPKTNLTITGTDTIEQATIRIPLDNSFGEQLVHADTTAYSDPVSFKTFCYGLKICCESVGQDGAICYLNPTSNTVTKLQVYYRETPSDDKQMRYDFYITSDDIYFNQYLHDYTLGSAEFVGQVIQNDQALGQSQLYLQSMGGVRSLLTFPGITEWAEQQQEEGCHIIINEAKLILPSLTALADTCYLTPPSSLALLSVNADGGTSLLDDYFEGSGYYGGSYSNVKHSVTFRISEYLQSVVQGSSSQGLYLSIAGAAYNAQRWVVAGPEADQDSKLKCEIKYSIVRE